MVLHCISETRGDHHPVYLSAARCPPPRRSAPPVEGPPRRGPLVRPRSLRGETGVIAVTLATDT